MGIAALTAACIPNVAPRPVPTASPPEPTSVPRPLVFPSDEVGHNDRIEWWYYNGHLTSESGMEFGYHFVVFKQQIGEDRNAFAGQFSLSDVRAQRRKQGEVATARPIFSSSPEALSLKIFDWQLNIDEAGHRLAAENSDGDWVDLRAVPTTPMMIHHEDGWFGYLDLGWSYYYSWPRMRTEGTISIDGVAYEVSGETWFDHQWGDFYFVGYPSGWQWFAVQFENGGSLMVTEARDLDGKPSLIYATYQTPEGENIHIDQDVVVEQLDFWESPHTGATYPIRWRLNVPEIGADLLVNSLFNDQEVNAEYSQISIYWEGKVSVEGTLRNSPAKGQAFVELSGYVQPAPLPWKP